MELKELKLPHEAQAGDRKRLEDPSLQQLWEESSQSNNTEDHFVDDYDGPATGGTTS